ncbi:MAG: hypothetical protein DA408_08160 [Bacteroidetes bacterium]|nr:MAG: hypothetical protein C7N36_09730 [Bacteroidota bacterium]PTM13043.1 MAG: hypothetical protein DA408_08160 [Bacteroidota bacterium]
MQPNSSLARRYHWNSNALESFTQEPHTAICGDHQGEIINLVHKKALPTQDGILAIAKERPEVILQGIAHLKLPVQYGVKEKDIDLKRLGSILWLAQENEVQRFDELLLLKGLGPRTLQSLILVSEVIHGTASRFSDPARFSFAHGSKGGNPFPVPTKVYDEVIVTLKKSVERAKIGETDKNQAIKKLTELAQKAEENFTPNNNLEGYLQQENATAWKYGGRTIKGFAQPAEKPEMGGSEG